MFFKTASGISLILLVVLVGLQAFPVTGIFLMVLGGPLWTGLLVHVFLLALAVEGWLRRVPRELVLIPLIAYGSYYALYVHQTIDMARTSAQLRSSNSGKVIDFNPDIHSLVTPAAQAFIQTHALPVAYESNAYALPERHVSFRLMRPEQCKLQKDSLNRIQTSGVSSREWNGNGPCLLRFPEVPAQALISVIKIGDEDIWKHKHEIGVQTSQVIADGKIIGTYKTASIWRLPLLPFLIIGCGLDSGAPAWRCFADAVRSHTVLDTVPDGIDRQRFDSPESVMLGIPKYTAAEFSSFRAYPQNDTTYAWLLDEPKRVEDRMFALIQELAEGGYPKVPVNIGFSVAQNPARLAPLARAMANRFIELSNIRPDQGDGQEYNYRYEGLAKALTALPDEAFASVALPLRAYFVEGMSTVQFRELNNRILLVSNLPSPDFYEADLMSARGYRQVFPVLAICRIGRTTPEVIAEMKARLLLESDASTSNDDNKTALIVTLIKLGQADFVQDSRPRLVMNTSTDFDSWLDAVLSGKGATAAGPNNCMTRTWNGRRAAKPSLHLVNGKWYVRS